MNPTSHPVAVLIPYFQRQPGILANTVRSVLAQQGFDDYQVIVVDDGSPVPAADELVGITEQRDKITIINQPNAGPGAARNTALEHIPKGTRYVAFLDSDDQLQPHYLADAVYALNQGYDLFFGNSQRADIANTRFEWDSGPGATLDVAQHRLLDGERALYEFQGDFFDFMVYRSNIIGTSSMIYRYSLCPDLRFNTQIYNGQDRVFKLSLCQRTNKIVFSPKICTNEGKGINIFDSAGWGSERSLSLSSSYIDMCKVILRDIPLQPQQRAHVQQHLARTRYGFTASLLHQARQGIPINWSVVGKTLRTDPGTLLRLIPNTLKVMFNKVKPS